MVACDLWRIGDSEGLEIFCIDIAVLLGPLRGVTFGLLLLLEGAADTLCLISLPIGLIARSSLSSDSGRESKLAILDRCGACGRKGEC